MDPKDHLADTGKMIEAGKGATRRVDDVFLSRYACYLIVQNGDPSKPEIALGQTYFAIQTRRQELADKESETSTKRFDLHGRTIASFKILSEAAKNAGVKSYGAFHDAGVQGLYGGIHGIELKIKKGIPVNRPLHDFMGATELAANDFRQTQAAERLIRDQTRGESQAVAVHSEVGKAVRNFIIAQGNQPPEELPTAVDIKSLPAPSTGLNATFTP